MNESFCSYNYLELQEIFRIFYASQTIEKCFLAHFLCLKQTLVWEVFSKHIRFEVGMGDRVRFWTDQWCGDLHLHLSFPVVYGIAINREASVASSLERMGTEARRSWKVPLLRNPNDWESGDVDDFLHILGDNLPPSEQRDRMIWKLSKKGEFCLAPNPIPGFVTMTDMLISSLNLILTRTNLTFNKTFTEAFLFL